jgi:hypothetical protein
MYATKKTYITLAIIAIIGLALAGILSFSLKQPYAKKTYVPLYSSNDINISTYKTNIGNTTVTGENSILIQDYLNTVLRNNFSNLGVKVDYKKEPSIDSLNKIFNDKQLLDSINLDIYSKIYTIIQNNPNQIENVKIINSLISNGFKLSPLSKQTVEKTLATTTIKGTDFKNLTNQVLALKQHFTASIV